jgi:hypothetical protein
MAPNHRPSRIHPLKIAQLHLPHPSDPIQQQHLRNLAGHPPHLPLIIRQSDPAQINEQRAEGPLHRLSQDRVLSGDELFGLEVVAGT